MKQKKFIQLSLYIYFGMVFISSVSAKPIGCNSVDWFCEIYSLDSSYIKVTIDARRLGENQYITDVSFGFTFYDAQKKHLATDSMRFDNAPAKGLEPRFYEIYLKHSYSAASLVRGSNMTYNCKTRGVSIQRTRGSELRIAARDKNWRNYPAENEVNVIGTPAKTTPTN